MPGARRLDSASPHCCKHTVRAGQQTREPNVPTRDGAQRANAILAPQPRDFYPGRACKGGGAWQRHGRVAVPQRVLDEDDLVAQVEKGAHGPTKVPGGRASAAAEGVSRVEHKDGPVEFAGTSLQQPVDHEDVGVHRGAAQGEVSVMPYPNGDVEVMQGAGCNEGVIPHLSWGFTAGAGDGSLLAGGVAVGDEGDACASEGEVAGVCDGDEGLAGAAEDGASDADGSGMGRERNGA